MRTTTIAVCSAIKNTMKTIQIILTTILLLSLTSAITIIAGTNYTLNFTGEVSDCYISNNQSNLEGLIFTENGSNVIIKTVLNYKPDNFTISCLVRQAREEQTHSSGSRGSSCKFNKNYNWECSDWTECTNEIQTRTCKEKNNCGSTYGRPNITQSCSLIQDDPIIDEPEEPEPEEPTPIGDERFSFPSWIIILLITLVIVVMVVFIVKSRLGGKDEKNEKNENS